MTSAVYYITTREQIGIQGETHEFLYEKVVFRENGHFDIKGNVVLRIDEVINEKEADSIDDFEFKVTGDNGENGADGTDGHNTKDGGNGTNGEPTTVMIKIGCLRNSVKVISIGGKGGDGGKGLNGLNGGNGGDAEQPKVVYIGDYPKGGKGGDGSNGRGRGGNGGDGGDGPVITVEYTAEKDSGVTIEFKGKQSSGGKCGMGGIGGIGGLGGLNGNGTRAKSGSPGKPADPGNPGKPGKAGTLTVNPKEKEEE